MKNKCVFQLFKLIGLILLFLFYFYSCKKENNDTIPTVLIVSVTDITATTAKINTKVVNDGGVTVTATGVCWSKSINPNISNNTSNVGQGVGEYITVITGLDTNTTYHVRAYATNKVGTAYSDNVSFTTQH